MTRDSRYDILFEPVRIGPVTARNRFFQVPHCNGMGHLYPTSMAAMRGVKAEGGWAVVCTEECEIHHTSEVAPYIEGRPRGPGDRFPLAPSIIASAVYAGHRYARELDEPVPEGTPFKRELPALGEFSNDKDMQ